MALVLPVSLFAIMAFLVAYGYSATARRTSHALSAWLLRGIQVIPLIGPTVSDAAIALTRYVTHELGSFAKPAASQLVKWLAGLKTYVAVVGYWTLLWPKELFTFAYWLLHTYLPKVLRAVPPQVVKAVNGTVKIIRRVETRVIHTTRYVRAAGKAIAVAALPRWVRAFSLEAAWLKRHWKALTAAVAGAGAITLPWGAAGRLERRVARLGKQLARLEKLAAGLGAAALVAVALRRLRLGWVRCRNVGKVGRRLCGVDNLLLDMLLADLGLVLGAFSLVEFARELQRITPAVVDSVGFVVREAPEAFHEYDADVLAFARSIIPGA